MLITHNYFLFPSGYDQQFFFSKAMGPGHFCIFFDTAAKSSLVHAITGTVMGVGRSREKYILRNIFSFSYL